MKLIESMITTECDIKTELARTWVSSLLRIDVALILGKNGGFISFVRSCSADMGKVVGNSSS